jgi:hypothetical protein
MASFVVILLWWRYSVLLSGIIITLRSPVPPFRPKRRAVTSAYYSNVIWSTSNSPSSRFKETASPSSPLPSPSEWGICGLGDIKFPCLLLRSDRVLHTRSKDRLPGARCDKRTPQGRTPFTLLRLRPAVTIEDNLNERSLAARTDQARRPAQRYVPRARRRGQSAATLQAETDAFTVVVRQGDARAV